MIGFAPIGIYNRLMTRRKKIKKPAHKVKQTSVQHPKTLLHANRTSLVVGGLVVTAGLIVLAVGGYKYFKHRMPIPATSSVSISPAVSATPSVSTSVSITQTAQHASSKATASSTKNMQANNQISVKTLPFTKSSPITYTVQENDSLASIGMKFCEDPRAWLILADKNNLYEPYTIHPGDKLTVSCK